MILNTQKTQKGFSLLELLLVVAVGAILILAGLAIYRNITNNTDVNEASRLVGILKQETQRIYQGDATYGVDGDNLNTILTNANVVPAKYTNGVGAIQSPFDTAVSVIVAADTTRFRITMEDVPPAGCVKLGTQYTANDTDFVGVRFGSEGTIITQPTVATVNEQCGTSGATIGWIFE